MSEVHLLCGKVLRTMGVTHVQESQFPIVCSNCMSVFDNRHTFTNHANGTGGVWMALVEFG